MGTTLSKVKPRLRVDLLGKNDMGKMAKLAAVVGKLANTVILSWGLEPTLGTHSNLTEARTLPGAKVTKLPGVR